LKQLRRLLLKRKARLLLHRPKLNHPAVFSGQLVTAF
jgi:hypothetical protein